MNIYFRPGDRNLGDEFGRGVREGLSSILEKKLSMMEQQHNIDRRKKTFQQANLPEWLAELPDNMQTMLLKEYEFLPEEQKQQVNQQLQEIGKQYWSDWGQQGGEQGIRGTLQNLQQAQPQEMSPMLSPLLNPQQRLEQPQQDTIPGMNRPSQAGEGFTNQRQSYDNAAQQMMPMEGTGDQGAPSQTAKGAPEGPKKYRMVPRGGAGLGGDKYAAKQREQEFKEQSSLRPLLTKEITDIRAQQGSRKIAKEMLDNLRKNKNKWPGFFQGMASKAAGEWVLRDPDIRKYVADATKLVSAEANTRRGQPTNFKLKLEALSKADLSMPYETQEALLESIVNKGDEAEMRLRFINNLKDKEGSLPLDIGTRIAEFDMALDNPLEYPQYFKKNDQIEEDGITYIHNGKDWEEA